MGRNHHISTTILTLHTFRSSRYSFALAFATFDYLRNRLKSIYFVHLAPNHQQESIARGPPTKVKSSTAIKFSTNAKSCSLSSFRSSYTLDSEIIFFRK